MIYNLSPANSSNKIQIYIVKIGTYYVTFAILWTSSAELTDFSHKPLVADVLNSLKAMHY